MNLPNVFFITCDESQYILPVTDYLMNKYATKLNVNYLGYTNPNYKLSDNSKFIELNNGNQRNVNNWFSDLFNYFSSIDDEYVIFTVDDNPIVEYLDYDSLHVAMDFMRNNKQIGILFCHPLDENSDNPISYENENYKFFYLGVYGHKTTSQMNIWKRTTLLNVLSSNYNNLVGFETQSEKYLFEDKVAFLKNKFLLPACGFTLCSDNRNNGYVFVLPLKPEDITYCIENNLLDKNKINYNNSHTYVFPYDYFNGNFNYDKMRQYIKENNWDENNLGWNDITTWINRFPSHI